MINEVPGSMRIHTPSNLNWEKGFPRGAFFWRTQSGTRYGPHLAVSERAMNSTCRHVQFQRLIVR